MKTLTDSKTNKQVVSNLELTNNQCIRWFGHSNINMVSVRNSSKEEIKKEKNRLLKNDDEYFDNQLDNIYANN